MEKNCEFENVINSIKLSVGNRKSDITTETITALIHEHIYDRLNDSNDSNDGKEINHVKNDRTSETGRTNPMQTEQRKDRNTKSKSRETIDADNAGHRTGRDSAFAQQKWQNVEAAKEEATTKRCADRQNEYNTLKEQHHRQKTTGNTKEFKE